MMRIVRIAATYGEKEKNHIKIIACQAGFSLDLTKVNYYISMF
jgi:hypothetical protein